MNALLHTVEQNRSELDALRRGAPGGMTNYDHVTDLELTYTSTAIEGNTLTAAETTLVVEQGITVAGKPLRDHLEAIDHFEALAYVRRLARDTRPVSELDLRNLHRLVMLRSSPDGAGRYAIQGRYVLTDTGRHAFPSPAEVPSLMAEFAGWLPDAAGPLGAFDAHRRLVEIHPFDDGNGRTARLLMNLLLIRDGYPPVAVRPIDRPAYIAALQAAQQGQGTSPFNSLLLTRLNAALDEAIAAARQAAPQ